MSIESLPKYLFSSIILCNLNSRLVSKKFKEGFDFGCRIYIWNKAKEEATDNLKNRMNLLEEKESNGFLLIRKFFEPSRKIKFDNFFPQMRDFQNLQDLSFRKLFSSPEINTQNQELTVSEIRDWLSKEENQKQLTELKEMTVSMFGADIVLAEEITLFTNLTTLNIGQVNPLEVNSTASVFSGEVSFFPKEIARLEGLTTLTCQAQKRLSFLYEGFYALKNLTTLEITLSEISSFSKEFSNLEKLTQLNLSNNKNLYFLPDFTNFTNLTSLNINYTPIKLFPEGFCTLTSLKKLEMSYNKDFPSLPKDFGCLVSLEEVSAVQCNLSSLPESMSKMTQLRRLYLMSNQFTSFPSSVKEIFKPYLSPEYWNTCHKSHNVTREDPNWGSLKLIDLSCQNNDKKFLPWEENKN